VIGKKSTSAKKIVGTKTQYERQNAESDADSNPLNKLQKIM
jgi:hypothetical protein